MLKYGDNNIGKVYLGSNSIGKAYLGSNLVFQKGSSPTPSIQPVFYDRLVFDGTAYIDTNIVPPENFSIRINLGHETLKAPQRIFMCKGTNDTAFGMLLNNSTTSSTRYFNVLYGSTGALSSNHTLSFSDTPRFSLFLTPYRFGWGDTPYTITKGSGIPNGGLIFGSNVSHSGQPFTGRMAVIRIYGSDAQNAADADDLYYNYTPLYNLRPCTYNNEAGLWCVETSTFYGNTADSGTLTVLNDE